MCSLRIAHRRERSVREKTSDILPYPLCCDMYCGVVNYRYGMTGPELYRWELGFSQSRFHRASRTCGASHYIPSCLAALLTCYFPLCLSTLGRSVVLAKVICSQPSASLSLSTEYRHGAPKAPGWLDWMTVPGGLSQPWLCLCRERFCRNRAVVAFPCFASLRKVSCSC